MMRGIGSGLSSVAVLALMVSGCSIEPVDFIAPAPASLGCEAIITRDARLPFPDDQPIALAAGLVGDAGAQRDKSEDAGAAYDKIRTMLEVPTETPAAAPEASRMAPEEPISDSVLVLSGGSQQGAFGAGFIKQWADARTAQGKPSLPRFRLVTGISTGSLQSTFAFLDRPEVPLGNI